MSNETTSDACENQRDAIRNTKFQIATLQRELTTQNLSPRARERKRRHLAEWEGKLPGPEAELRDCEAGSAPPQPR